MHKKEKVILLGDSITQGLGSKKVNFTQALQNKLGGNYIVENMALTGTTILYAREILHSVISHKPKYVVILYGNVDAQIRPNRQGVIFPYIPGRFRKNGMLMPRPFYSHSFIKRLGQKIDNSLRKLFSSVIYKVDGSEQWVEIDTFSATYNFVVNKLLEAGIQVIACSTVFIDEKLFHGSLSQYKIFNKAIAAMADNYHFIYVDLLAPLEKAVKHSGWDAFYNYDHFHPKSGGYELIADILAQQIHHTPKVGEREFYGKVDKKLHI